MSEIPTSAVIEILSRLPLKTLVQCRYVCKSWSSMLSEVYFYNLYSTHTPTMQMIKVKGYNMDCLRNIYVVDTNNYSSFVSHGVYIKFGPKEESSEQEEEESRDDPINYELGNSCNGLICLMQLWSREAISIWNPIMGQYVNLPQSLSFSDRHVVVGFGFSPRSKVYKVLRIFHEKAAPAANWAAEIYDFGVSSSTWRRIGDAPCPIPSRVSGFFINSSLHWILNYASSPGPNQLICSFDFNIEGFRFIPPPPIFSVNEKTKYHWSNLGVLAGYLSICAIDAKNFRPDVQVWVMNEYGDPKSWVKKLSIRDPVVDWWDPYRSIQVTNFLKNGEILLLCSHHYVLTYDPRARTFLDKEVLNFPAIAHLPSFVSLKHALREDDPTAMDVKCL